MLKDVAYQSNTQEFWNSCVQICDERITVWEVLLMMGKASLDNERGFPRQCNSRFNGVNVINTARKI
jgi:TldD protein